MTDMRSEAGYGLVETLIALVIVAFAATATVQIVSSGLRRQAEDQVRAEAVRVLQLPFELGAPAAGQASLGDNDRPAQWQVVVGTIEQGRLGGVPVEWVEIQGRVSWWSGTRERTVSLRRVDIQPSTASP